MTYHPKEMMPSALFLATKTENHYTSLKSFVSNLKKTTAEDVIAPEFLLTQGLRFTFDVRHPQRSLEGGFMELLDLVNGRGDPSMSIESKPDKIQQEMMDIAPVKGGSATQSTPGQMVTRIKNAHGRAKEVLKTSALLTDVYFLYTPAQCWLSTLLLVDEPLALFYIGTKLPTSSAIKPKLLITLKACRDMLQSSASVKPGEAEIKELTRIDKKLYKCRNPEKVDLVGINKAKKRDGDGKAEASLGEKTMKKRKLERENGLKEEDALFGPALGK